MNIIHRPDFYLKCEVSKLNSISVFRWNLLSWTKYIEIVSFYRHQQQRQ
jgi:hypothetical protein